MLLIESWDVDTIITIDGHMLMCDAKSDITFEIVVSTVQQQAAPSKLTVYRSFYKLLHFCVNE
jgi:hypothetical protein